MWEVLGPKALGIEALPPRSPGRVVEVSTGRGEARGDGLESEAGAPGTGRLDGHLNGPWTLPRAVEGPVQVTLAQKHLVFAFSHFVSCPKVRGITISPPWDHSSLNDT